MSKSVTSKAEVADSDDIRIGAAMVDAQVWKAYDRPLDPDSQLPAIFERLKEYADRLEAIEKDAGLKKAVKYLNFYFHDRTPDVRVPAEKNTLLVLTALLSLVPSLSEGK